MAKTWLLLVFLALAFLSNLSVVVGKASVRSRFILLLHRVSFSFYFMRDFVAGKLYALAGTTNNSYLAVELVISENTVTAESVKVCARILLVL